MRTSSFSLTEEDVPLLAKGYDSPTGAPVPFTQIYLRPAGNLHTSPRELGAFVQMLLNWGETSEQLVIDPEYLSNMERPRSSLSAKAGLIYGYGSGIASFARGLPRARPRRRHRRIRVRPTATRPRGMRVGGAGQRHYAPTAVERLSELAVRYLKRDVEPPAKPDYTVPPGLLEAHAGYYHPEGSRNEVLSAMTWISAGATMSPDGNALVMRPVFGAAERYIPVSNTLFRRERDVTPSRVFTIDEGGRAVLLGDGYYGVRTPRWRVEAVRGAMFLSLAIVASMPIALLVWLGRLAWRWRRGDDGTRDASGFWLLKVTLCLIPVAALAFFGIAMAPQREWGAMNTWTRLTFVGSWAVPLLSLVAVALVAVAWRRGAGRWFAAYATAVTGAALCLSAYLAAWGLVGLRPWAY